jgi:hypothetical protein
MRFIAPKRYAATGKEAGKTESAPEIGDERLVMLGQDNLHLQFCDSKELLGKTAYPEGQHIAA